MTQLTRRDRVLSVARLFFFISVFVTIGYLFYFSYLQYQAFQEGPLGITLGTTEGLKWFFGYARFHFWNPYIVSLIASFLIIFAAKYFNKKRGEVHFEYDELYVAALGIFLVGYPGILFYIPLILIISALVSAIFIKKDTRLPLYYFWIPTAAFTLGAIQFWTANTAWWTNLRF